MKVPSISEAEDILQKAQNMNPGMWVSHCRVAAICAKTIANKYNAIDEEAAYVMGLLHDIGRRFGASDASDLGHVLFGYTYMKELGFDDCAQLCLTHSFPVKNVLAFSGKIDLSVDEVSLLTKTLENCEYNEYDKLIQLCDCLAYPTGPCIVEKRLVDVVIRRGFNDLTINKWNAFLGLRDYFSQKVGVSVYSLFNDLVL